MAWYVITMIGVVSFVLGACAAYFDAARILWRNAESFSRSGTITVGPWTMRLGDSALDETQAGGRL